MSEDDQKAVDPDSDSSEENTEDTATDTSAEEPGESAGEDDQDSALEQGEAGESEGKAGKHILIVEDTKLLRAMLVKIATEMGHVVEEADNGHYALAMVKRAKASGWEYDLILTDLMMPEMDGWTLIKQLREKKFFPRIPIIVLTANAGRDSVIKCGRMGITHYIVKPFQAARVIETINQALKIDVDEDGENTGGTEEGGAEDQPDGQPEVPEDGTEAASTD